ncbi:MAG: hypothetical protein IJH31_06330 [Erysipelotrichaceae bacterium]|nr:hypothetical protein [Erysipelotrichaceae bacterium]
MKKKSLYILIISIVLCISLLLINMLIINPKQLKIREETVITNDSNLDGLLIAYFSDIHYGNNFNENNLDKVLNKLNEFKPDLIIFGGDLLSNIKKGNEDYLKEALSNLKPKYGKIAVMGDDDYLNDRAYNILLESNFSILNNSHKKININNSFINVVGIEALINGNPNIENAFEGINDTYYTISVSHCPDIVNRLGDLKTNLFLSGHSLGGPIYIPLINYLYRPNGAKNYYHGKYKIENMVLDISNGVGTIKKDIRLFADAEIVFYRFKKSS